MPNPESAAYEVPLLPTDETEQLQNISLLDLLPPDQNVTALSETLNNAPDSSHKFLNEIEIYGLWPEKEPDRTNEDPRLWQEIDMQPSGDLFYTVEPPKDMKEMVVGDKRMESAGFLPELFARSNGLEVDSVTENGVTTYEFFVTVDGEKQVILVTNTNDYFSKIQEARKETIERLEQTYNVDILEGDEGIDPAKGDDIALKTPDFDELVALEIGLAHSSPSNLTLDGKPLKIGYAEERVKRGLLGRYYNPNVTADGAPTIFFTPLLNGGEIEDQVETVLHELAHNGEFNSVRADGEAEQERYYELAGWEKGLNGDYYLKGKDGYLYDYSRILGRWTRVDIEGNPLDKNGQRAIDDIVRIKNERMKELALVEPVSDYFVLPQEMLAEAMVEFRRDKKSRIHLLATNPELYAVLQQIDQDEINTHFPPVNGEPQFIRSFDGTLVANTEENRQEIIAQERIAKPKGPISMQLES